MTRADVTSDGDEFRLLPPFHSSTGTRRGLPPTASSYNPVTLRNCQLQLQDEIQLV